MIKLFKPAILFVVLLSLAVSFPLSEASASYPRVQKVTCKSNGILSKAVFYGTPFFKKQMYIRSIGVKLFSAGDKTGSSIKIIKRKNGKVLFNKKIKPMESEYRFFEVRALFPINLHKSLRIITTIRYEGRNFKCYKDFKF